MPLRFLRQKPAGDPLIGVGFDDPFPEALLSGLLGLPREKPMTDDETHSIEPRSKRRKLDLKSPSICVCEGYVTFTRRTAKGSPLSERRYDGDQRVQLQYSESSRTWWISGPAFEKDQYALSVKDENMSQDWRILGKTARLNGPTRRGDVWAQRSVQIKRDQAVTTVTFEVKILWDPVSSPSDPYGTKAQRDLSSFLIEHAYPDPHPQIGLSQWSPMDFYDAVYVPPKDDPVPGSIEIPQLDATLYPFQKQAVQWALRREGVEWSADERGITGLPSKPTPTTSSLFREVTDMHGQTFYVSDVLRLATRDLKPFTQAEASVTGGILAEEMGLGKTLEVISLILLHQRDTSPRHLVEAHPGLTHSTATLIVTPASLRQQWLTELAKHAPTLRVYDYKGCKSLKQREYDSAVAELAASDVVITTYAVLSAELHFAIAPPDRSRRQERKYERKESPLVKIDWWRLCLDEAQMIENGFSQAAQVARAIPRANAWAITGTPVKDGVQDLFGLLIFLGYQPFCNNINARQALVSGKKAPFQILFNSIALRHTKALVRDQLRLPPQKRYVISIPFTAVEEQLYQSLFREMARECGLDEEGGPLSDDWTPENHVEEMRSWLNRLRQTALHPEVGAQNRRALGSSRNRPLRTVDEVLDAMLDQSDAAMKADERAYLSSKLTRGQLFENSPRVREALEIWLEVRDEVRALVAEARGGLRLAIQESKATDPHQSAPPLGSENDLSSDEGLDETESRRIGEARRRLRFALEMLHKAVFFCANAYFQIRDNPEMTSPESEEYTRLKRLEDEGYEEAKVLRREILKQSHRRATRLMLGLAKKAKEQTFAEVPELSGRSEKGIETSRITEDLEILYDKLNEQANVIDEWREHIIQLLLKPLLDEEVEAEFTGEELADSTKLQDELMVYVTALRATILDREDAITGQRNELNKYETTTAKKLAKDGNGPAPEKLLELLDMRDRINPRTEGFSMRSAISQFRTLTVMYGREAGGGATQRTIAEHKIASLHLEFTQAQMKKQHKVGTALESEIEEYRAAMNARVEFYRQLQAVSDSVLPYEGAKGELTALIMQRNEDDLLKKLAQARAKHRYLLNLKGAGSKSSEPRICVICQSSFTTGVLTVCGHQFCRECMMMWFKHRHNCPTCKRQLTTNDLHDITMQPRELRVHSETETLRPANGEPSSSSSPVSAQKMRAVRTTGIYSEFNADKLAEIKNIELDGPSFTTKVDMLIQHLLWLRETDPGAKTIMFSQYKDFLTILRTALGRYRIGFSSIDDASGITKFTTDPSIEVFLLHARAHSSGLNLVNANHVFLCEPLLNTALELQAIARVDRIGQQHETKVWLYLISGTVEESIHELSVQRRMQHMQRSNENNNNNNNHSGSTAQNGKARESTPDTNLVLLDSKMDEANTLEMEHASLSKLMSKDRAAGEMVDKGDLWECLFGHVTRSRQAATQDNRMQEQAVIGYLAAEAAEARRAEGLQHTDMVSR